MAESNLIFESSAENIDVKKMIASRVGASMKGTAVSCTGTSGLSINDIAQAYPERVRSRFFGVHMFNPPYSMSLCEFSVSEYSDPVGASGARMLLDPYKQVTGTAGKYQIAGAKDARMLNIGGSATTNYVYIVGMDR